MVGRAHEPGCGENRRRSANLNTDLGLQSPRRLRKLCPQRLAGAGMKNFCVLAYVDGRPVSAERLVASSAAEAVSQLLTENRLASCEVFEGRRKVAVLDRGFVTIAGQPHPLRPAPVTSARLALVD